MLIVSISLSVCYGHICKMCECDVVCIVVCVRVCSVIKKRNICAKVKLSERLAWVCHLGSYQILV